MPCFPTVLLTVDSDTPKNAAVAATLSLFLA